jgi:hypothetical protein
MTRRQSEKLPVEHKDIPAKKKKRQRKPLPLQPSLMQPRAVTAQQLGTSVQSVIGLEITEENPGGLLHVYRLSGRPTGRVSHDCEEVKTVRQRLAASQGLPLPEADDAEPDALPPR